MYQYFVKNVLKVVDGDTIDVEIDLGFDLTKKERVRLGGIDTPESRTRDLEEKKLGLQAKDYLKSLIMNADKLIVRTEKDGKFGRMIGYLYMNPDATVSLNQMLIDEGFAWMYDGGTKKKDLQELLDKRRMQ
ncbi:thermonuclease family protein [bacterium]|nr:thermonuclease family protein [bacterium]MDB4454963.1 thermonuclease family protein [bacterium]